MIKGLIFARSSHHEENSSVIAILEITKNTRKTFSCCFVFLPSSQKAIGVLLR